MSIVPSYNYQDLLDYNLADGGRQLVVDLPRRTLRILPASQVLPKDCYADINLVSRAILSLRDLFSGMSYIEDIPARNRLYLFSNCSWLMAKQREHNNHVETLCCRISSIACICLCCIPCCSRRIACETVLTELDMAILGRKLRISPEWPNAFDVNNLLNVFLTNEDLLRQFPDIVATLLGETLVRDQKELLPDTVEKWLIVADKLDELAYIPKACQYRKIEIYPDFFLRADHSQFFLNCLYLIQFKQSLIPVTTNIASRLVYNVANVLSQTPTLTLYLLTTSRVATVVDTLMCHQLLLCNTITHPDQSKWIDLALSTIGFQRTKPHDFLRACDIIQLHVKHKPPLQRDLCPLTVPYRYIEPVFARLGLEDLSLILYSYYTFPTEKMLQIVVDEMERSIPKDSMDYETFLRVRKSVLPQRAKEKFLRHESSAAAPPEPLAITVIEAPVGAAAPRMDLSDRALLYVKAS